MKQMSRMFAENYIVPIFKYIILLDQKYMDQEQIIRLTNENITITRDELNIDYDLVINVGLGPGTKEAQIQYLMVMINQIYPQLAQAGLVTPKSWYNIISELLEKMGIRNVQNYILDPDSAEAQQLQQQQQQAAEQQKQEMLQMEQMKAQWEIQKASAPKTSVSVQYPDMPPAAQMQLLQAIGANVNSEDIIQKEELESVKEFNKKLPIPTASDRAGADRNPGQTAGPGQTAQSPAPAGGQPGRQG